MYGYQSIGQNTFHISVSWRGEPWFGIGYTRRKPGASFTDWTAEWRFPVQSIFELDNHEVIAGLYKPVKVKRSFMAYGIHAKITKQTTRESKTIDVGLALTGLPSYTYSSSVSGDGPYGTMALRATYNPTIYRQQTSLRTGEKESWTLPSHGVIVGGHLDLLLQRTVGFSTSAGLARAWSLGKAPLRPNEDQWKIGWDFSAGSTYWLLGPARSAN